MARYGVNLHLIANFDVKFLKIDPIKTLGYLGHALLILEDLHFFDKFILLFS
jgi:hypothetical protein